MTRTRRQFLSSSVAGGLLLRSAPSHCADSDPIVLSEAHRELMEKRRQRIVIQHDVYHVMRNYARMHPDSTAPFAPFRDAVFSYVDDPGSQIDAIWWDIGGNTVAPVYPSKVLPPVAHPLLQAWLEKGIDWVAELVQETRRRKREVVWSYRISEVDGLPEGGHEKEQLHPLKAAHPDWTTPCSYWWQGMWNLASEGLREHKVAELRELATHYDLDGFQIDFARHMPVLPVGQQWEMREHVTEFMRLVRRMLLEVAEERGRPYLLAARVPRNLEGCRIDGLDVADWAELNLIDVLTLGSRSLDVDVEGFREVVGDQVQLQPCYDDHHSTDGYRYQSIEFLRGAFANHWQRGANSVVAFNWPIGPPEVAGTVGGEVGSAIQGEAFREVGDPKSLEGKDKIFAVERRGGYPWSDGFFNRNDTAPLPIQWTSEGEAIKLLIQISDAPTGSARLILRLVFFGAGEQDAFALSLNEKPLEQILRDPDWKDAQIFSPKPQPASGGKGNYRINPDQQLLCIEFGVPSDGWQQGINQIALRQTSEVVSSCQLEKLEAALEYR